MQLRRSCGAAVLAGVLGLAGACVDPFAGSSINVTLDPGVQAPATAPGPTTGGQPPASTYYAFYAVKHRRDADGHIVGSDMFEVQRFEIRPLITVSSPCLIELEEDRYPGLHVTQVLARLEQDTGITDPDNPPSGTPEGDIVDVLTARERMKVLPLLQGGVKAVVGFSDNLGPGANPEFPVAATCADATNDPGSIPPPDCIDDDANRQRLAVCRAYWEADIARSRQESEAHYPTYSEGNYEGSDKVYTLPVNGRWHGAVTGSNPKNAGFLGGAQWFAPVPLDPYSVDELTLRWQYKDMDGDGEPDYPAGTLDADKSATGYLYMQGQPSYDYTRGTINVPLAHPAFSAITGEATIFPSLDEDNVHF